MEQTIKITGTTGTDNWDGQTRDMDGNLIDTNQTDRAVTFHRGFKGCQEMRVGGSHVATILYHSSGSFWYADPHQALAVDLDVYADTLKDLKETLRVQIAEHEGLTVWC